MYLQYSVKNVTIEKKINYAGTSINLQPGVSEKAHFSEINEGHFWTPCATIGCNPKHEANPEQ